MNTKQIKAMWIGVGVAVLMLFYPPRKYGSDFAGYGFLLRGSARVDTMLLLLQWFLVGAVTVCALLTFAHQETLPFTDPVQALLRRLFRPKIKESVSADKWNAWGVEEATAGNFEQALRYINEALKHNPNYAKSWYNKGLCLKNLQRYSEAAECFGRALQLDPDDAQARVKWFEVAERSAPPPYHKAPVLRWLLTWRGFVLLLVLTLLCLSWLHLFAQVPTTPSSGNHGDWQTRSVRENRIRRVRGE